MCGIVGYIGNKNARDIVIEGLEKLEYRGYDSAGIAVYNNDLEVYKVKGRVKGLNDLSLNVNSNICIGHTRWATHGVPNEVNAHPHLSYNERFVLVHNGVIENHKELIQEHLSDIKFHSETDTEVIVNLIAKLNETISLEESIVKCMGMLHGTFATLIIDKEDKDKMYLMKNKSPVLIGIGEGENFVASDALAMFKYTNKYYDLSDYEFAILSKNKVVIKDNNLNVVSKEIIELDIDASDMSKGVYDHYMLKEIDEQTSVTRKIVSKYEENNELVISNDILEELKNTSKIYIVAAGTSYHSGMVGKKYLEELAQIPCEVVIASEFNYSPPLIVDNSIFLFISQSGETQDLIKAMDLIKEKNLKSICVTNTKDSTLYRKSDYNLLLHAGREIAVASTKAYTSQVLVLLIIANNLSGNKIDLVSDYSKLSNGIETILNDKEKIKQITIDLLTDKRNCFYVGRGMDYYTTLEASLKLKEVSYIQTEGFAAGELKHGTIALIEEGTPVIGLISQDNVNLNTRSNIVEVESRGASSIIISTSNVSKETDDYVITDISYYINPLLINVVTQLISYYAALNLDLDIDKPRNLAKSVTVE